MKILVIHNLHRKGSASGDDQVFKNEIALLRENGHEVIEYYNINDTFDEANFLKKIFLTFGMLWSFENYKNVSNIIEIEKPDIIHIHTFFPLLSPSILYACKKKGGKVVATLHDTRFICPCATSLRENKLCNKCGDGRYFRMVRYRCFKDSRIKSLYVAFVFKIHRIFKTFYKKIDRYICLNDNQIKLLKEINFNEEKIVKKYNFVNDNAQNLNANLKETDLPNKYVVFYGRIGEEKGIRILQNAWENLDDIPLVIMGAGPLEKNLKTWCKDKKNVYFLGYQEHARCLEIVKKCEFVVFPSIWYEGCSMVEIETLSLGKPVIATDLGFSSEAIVNNFNGIKFELNNIEDFVAKVKLLWNNKKLVETMSKNAREDYLSKYSPEENYRQLMQIYMNLLN